MESVLQKQSKIRNLMNDLKKNYKDDDLAQQPRSFNMGRRGSEAVALEDHR